MTYLLGILQSITSKVWVYLMLSAFALLFIWKVYRAGENKEEVDSLRRTLDSVVRRNEIEEDTNSLDRTGILKQLRKHGWIRE